MTNVYTELFDLSNGLCAVLIHDPEIFPESGSSSPLQSSKTLENVNVEDQEEREDGSEEEQQEDELNKQKANTPARTKKGAGALCVGMGSFSDPIEVQGLAHLLGLIYIILLFLHKSQ